MSENTRSRIEKKNNGIFNGFRMLLSACILVSVCLLMGCSKSGADYLQRAAAFYQSGDYLNAEAEFLAAIRLGENNAAAWTGYAFNEMKAKNFEMARTVFLKCLELEKNNSDFYSKEKGNAGKTGEALRKGLYETCIILQDYSMAVDILRELGNTCTDKDEAAAYKAEAAALAWKVSDRTEPAFNTDEMIDIVSDSINSGNETVKTYRMRANLYYLKEDWADWEKDERKIIELKDYAFDEYCAIYDVKRKNGSSNEVLELLDEIYVYMLGHAAYIDSYDRLIAMALEAAEMCEYTAYEHDSEYYFNMAQLYIDSATEQKLTDNQVLKYEIIIAERKGKYELAYKLLGVYLEHCPDDRMALKEKNYLECRVGIKDKDN